jgi:hypothetical protein
VDGWAVFNFDNGTFLDQAWVGYDFESAAAFVNSGITATSLDDTNCGASAFGSVTH